MVFIFSASIYLDDKIISRWRLAFSNESNCVVVRQWVNGTVRRWRSGRCSTAEYSSTAIHRPAHNTSPVVQHSVAKELKETGCKLLTTDANNLADTQTLSTGHTGGVCLCWQNNLCSSDGQQPLFFSVDKTKTSPP